MFALCNDVFIWMLEFLVASVFTRSKWAKQEQKQISESSLISGIYRSFMQQ